MDERRWTVLELSRTGAELLAARGIESARLDADVLLARVLGCERLELYLQHDMPVDLDRRAEYRALMKRRMAHEPVAYILGERAFLEWTFAVSPDVLIPRPETELLVETVTALARARGGDVRVLELGVGSGCVTVSLALWLPEARFVGVDLSPGAVGVARRNAERLGVDADRIVWREGDLYGALAVDDGPFDFIVSNPPYITEEERASLSPDVEKWEPGPALFVADDALEFHLRITSGAAPWLAPDGTVVMELPGAQGDRMTAAWVQGGGEAGWRPDLAGRPRVFVGSRNSIPEEVARHFHATGDVMDHGEE